MSGWNRLPMGISCTASLGRGLTAPPVSNSPRSNSWRSWRHESPCRMPTWYATAGVWRHTASSGLRSFPPRASRVWMVTKRSQEPRIGIGPGCWAAFSMWLWPPVFRHCVGGGKRADALRRRSRAKPCDLHPRSGDDPPPAPPAAGLRPTSHCPCPSSPRDICV